MGREDMACEERKTIPDGYRTVFDKLSITWVLVFVDDLIVVQMNLRGRFSDTLPFGHSGITKMTSEAKIFWWRELKQEKKTI